MYVRYVLKYGLIYTFEKRKQPKLECLSFLHPAQTKTYLSNDMKLQGLKYRINFGKEP